MDTAAMTASIWSSCRAADRPSNVKSLNSTLMPSFLPISRINAGSKPAPRAFWRACWGPKNRKASRIGGGEQPRGQGEPFRGVSVGELLRGAGSTGSRTSMPITARACRWRGSSQSCHTFPVSSACVIPQACLLYTYDAADERSSVDLGGRRIIKKKNKITKKKKEEREEKKTNARYTTT